ncbi:MAG TPA: CBS domain-containing protein [Nitrospira sp.]|nr:CBS domain-containing protein [Nitrospira sp.]
MTFWAVRHSIVPDLEIERRVRDKLRMLVRYPDAIRVAARRGSVTLKGPVLADEREYLIRLLRRLDGVEGVSDQLSVYEDALTAPELRPLVRRAPRATGPSAAPGTAENPYDNEAMFHLTEDSLGPLGSTVKGLTQAERLRLMRLREKAQRINEELTRGRRPAGEPGASEYGRKEYPMPLIRDVMTPQVEVISPDATAEDAADRMKQLNIGVIPVRDEQGLVGMLTDRDLVVRVMGAHRDPKGVLVGEVMTPDIVYGFEDQDVQEAAMLMADKQIRRLPVLNRQRDLVGILSLGDLAVHGQDQHLSGEVLHDVSQPSEPKR